MHSPHLTVREMQEHDVDAIVHYWTASDPVFLRGMGVDLNKLPDSHQFRQMLLSQLHVPIEQKKSYCIIWEADGQAIGHCNTNPTFYGQEAFMHLHLWKRDIRKQGLGLQLVKQTLPYFFDNLKLRRLYCEPYALNIAPNKTIEKAGFELVREYVTSPGSIGFEQPVKRWELTYEKFSSL